MPLILQSRSLDSTPVSLAGITPAALAEKSLAEIRKTLVWQGNRELPLAELLGVSGDASDMTWQLEGNFSTVHGIGSGMERGEIRVEGSLGRHAGQAMRGGLLTVAGDAGDWLGAEMRGGRIDVRGNVGHHAGGALVGSKVGMRGGQILVHGNAGTHAAASMRRGSVAVLGNCGEWAGYRMRAGTLLVLGACGARPGAGMRRGTIALLGETPELLPTFRYACAYEPVMLRLLLRELELERELDCTIDTQVSLFNGDLLEGGRGEVLVSTASR